jgi:catalase (peroxidase I)
MTPRLPRCAVTVLLALSFAASAQQNPSQRGSRGADAFAGRWNGAHLEQRAQCNASQNNGFHGTYAEYIVRADTAARTLGIDEIAVNGLNCNYFGNYGEVGGRLAWSGNLSCTDGRGGTFESQSLFAQGTVMSMRLTIRLAGSERCVIDALLGGSRF